MPNKKQRYIAVAGNMGVGKSTLVQFIASQFGGEAFYEPVDTNPYFKKFFGDMRRWAFHSQIYFLAHKFRIHQLVEKKSGLIVVDRTIYEDAEIFAKGLARARKMSRDDYGVYRVLYESMCESLRPPDCLIYLTSSIKTLKERIAVRGRKNERAVPTAYLRRLQKDYDAWVSQIDFCDVVTIKTDDVDYTSDLVHRADVISRLSRHIAF